jgi:soluble lytic murein transglycosylase-like protein
MRCARFLLACVAATATPTVAVRAQPVAFAVRAASEPYAELIAEAAQRFGIPAAWIRAVIRHESGGNPRAVSPKGAMGLMQLMPATWSALRARLGLGSDPFDRHDNIVAGTAFLREMHDRYGSPGFLAAYSAGPGRYEDYRDRHRPLPAETVAYVAALLPVIGGDDDAEPVLAAAPDPLAWTRAPIFITRAASDRVADPVPSNPPSVDVLVANPARNVSAVAPQSGGLFVAVSATGPKP